MKKPELLELSSLKSSLEINPNPIQSNKSKTIRKQKVNPGYVLFFCTKIMNLNRLEMNRFKRILESKEYQSDPLKVLQLHLLNTLS